MISGTFVIDIDRTNDFVLIARFVNGKRVSCDKTTPEDATSLVADLQKAIDELKPQEAA